ncbi:cell division protein ZapA [Seleniivibrio woodruffii]|uniref:Cell division protein ZapA n=1 Tax=Seleniivibrio woodruffii TaxID=1078050 RepID=A0A4R1KD98_9BACT|nr:cell division protein ZapA [Seleniivibrio woodruffii]TCK62566.1 cell division protein ZapA [Seleniivibrio woodruffii]TVZ37008.1 cell division protein ZapA (FtsZ GTPase activity inhibitor) [Seleniivibrio woodruffii]
MPVYEHKVNINGLQYPLVTDRDKEFVDRVTEMLQNRMNEIKSKINVLDTQKLAVMAALTISAQYLDLKEAAEAADAILDDLLRKSDK